MRLAHHVGDHGLIIEMLVDYAIRDIAIHAAASNLAAMNPHQRAQLAAGVRKLAPANPIADGVRLEKEVSLAFIERLFRAGKLDQLLKDLELAGPDVPENQQQLAREALKDPRTVRHLTDRLAAAYDRIIRDMGRPYAEAMQQLQAFAKESTQQHKKLKQDPKVNAADLLACMVAPGMSSAKTTEASMKIRHGMLLTAIAYADGGEQAAAKVTDPVTGNPFKITPVEGEPGWIELASTVTHGDKPITLRARIR